MTRIQGLTTTLRGLQGLNPSPSSHTKIPLMTRYTDILQANTHKVNILTWKEKDESLQPLTPQDRVKRSLERLDLPDWYKDRSLSPGQGPALRKTSWTDGDKSRARTRDRSLPPPSPLPSRHRSEDTHSDPISISLF